MDAGSLVFCERGGFDLCGGGAFCGVEGLEV